MAFEDIKAQIAMLLSDTQDHPDGLHEVYQKVKQELNDMRAFGMPLPEDLVELDRALDERFSQGLAKHR